MRKSWRVVLGEWMLLLGLAWLAGCQMNPATGKSNFNLFTQDQEIRLGTEAEPEFVQSYGGEIPSATVRNYVTSLGTRLAQGSERQGLPWSFHALDSSVVNAFALPGGKVFVTRGLLEKLHSEAELAGVLGHEIGHVTAQHQAQQMSRATALELVVQGIGLATEKSDKEWLQTLGVGAQVGGSLYLLKYGRDQETQADELGVRYMTRLGYNPMGQVRVMEVLRSLGSSGTLEMLSTHPAPQSRIDHLQTLITAQYPDHEQSGKYVWNEDAYQQQVLSELSRLPAAKNNGT